MVVRYDVASMMPWLLPLEGKNCDRDLVLPKGEYCDRDFVPLEVENCERFLRTCSVLNGELAPGP